MKKTKLPKITLDLLKELSTSESFIRGREYYREGLVSNLRIQDNVYIATVRGSYHYEVKISNEDNDVIFSCTCPYDWGGICKHCIAVGLQILNSKKEIKTSDNKKIESKDNLKFSKVFNKATLKQKNGFLKKILLENKDYREKFFAAILPQTELETTINIDTIKEQVIEILENFDLENYERLYDNQDRQYGYRDEWDILFEGAEEELRQSLEWLTARIENDIKNGNLIDAAKLLIGFYEGVSLADCYDINDPACIFDGEFNNQIESYFLEFYGSFISSFPMENLTSKSAERIINIVFRRIKKYSDNNTFSYDIFLFRDFLNILIVDKNSAKRMLKYLNEMKLINSSTDTVQLTIYKILGEEKKWLSYAEKYYRRNTEIAEELLEFYKNSDREKFLQIAKYVFGKWPDEFEEYLYKELKQNEDKDFFGKVLFHYAGRKQSLPLFRELRDRFGEDISKKFIKNAREHSLFYINLLNEQKEFDKILQFVKTHLDSWHFAKIIVPILNVFPKQCFEIIRNKSDEYLKENIGRKYYVEVAQWFELLKKIKDEKVKKEINLYFMELLQRYKMRPALKDELRKIGIK